MKLNMFRLVGGCVLFALGVMILLLGGNDCIPLLFMLGGFIAGISPRERKKNTTTKTPRKEK